MRNSVLFILVASVIPNAMASNGEKKDYKCFLKTTTVEQIAFYNWQVEKLELSMATLPARKVPNRNDGNNAYIKEVVECVGLDETFINVEAQKLDGLTVR